MPESKKKGRPPKEGGQMIRRSCQFEPDKMKALDAIADQTGKDVTKIIREGGDLIIEQYRAKGFDV